jgi:phosphoribosylglycinamide formyltransferase-1
MRAKVAVLISGRGSNMAALIYAARRADCGYEVALVASDKPDAPGLVLAAAEGVPLAALPPLTKSGRDRFYAALDTALRTAEVDLVALAGFMCILPTSFVDAWAGRILNIHPSLLPKYKGLNTHAAALANGDAHGGCSVHIVTPQLDDGPVLAQTPVAILTGDTPDALAARVLIAEHQLYARALESYVGRERDPDWLVAKVGELAGALPEVERASSHGAPGWRVGGKAGKFFAYVSIRHHGEDAIALLVKTSGQDEMAALIDRAPELYYRPAYYGASGWIAIRLDTGRTDWDLIADWLARSWHMVAPKRLTKLMRVADEF